MAPDINSLPPSRTSSSSSPSNPRIVDGLRRDTPSPRSSSTSLAATAALNAQIQSATISSRSRAGTGTGSISGIRLTSGVGLTSHASELGSGSPTGLTEASPLYPSATESPSASPTARRQERHILSSVLSGGASNSSLSGHADMPSPTRSSPSFPSMFDVSHRRTPSLGELHQELEAEQEAQVNRLLQMIRRQQLHIQALQQPGSHGQSAAIEDSTPTSDHSPSANPQTLPLSIGLPPAYGLPSSVSRRSSRQSRRSSRSHASPLIHPISDSSLLREATSADVANVGSITPSPSGGRDDTAFFQAETHSLTRENQMLKLRIRELERQVQDLNGSASAPPSSGIDSQPNAAPADANTE
ncbi:MAG: hypothetical protein M1814_003681 [Vezdaea aestivalis]|nr:MAG: hypothetical protein M1814_003681 [Vezdaea aestivalis]